MQGYRGGAQTAEAGGRSPEPGDTAPNTTHFPPGEGAPLEDVRRGKRSSLQAYYVNESCALAAVQR